MASTQMPAAPAAPTVPVPAELSGAWTLKPAFWYIEGEACDRRDGETDEDYARRVLKNKRRRAHALARQKRQQEANQARWEVEAAARAQPAQAPAPTEDWEQIALYWQRRCKAMEARFKNVIAAVGTLHHITAVEVDQAILEQPE
jgi:hypothetical protein